MAVESMSHCGCSSVEIQFSTFLLKTLPQSCLITHMCFWGSALKGMWNSGIADFLQTHIPPLSGSGDLFRVWQVGWWAGKLLLSAHSPRPQTIIISTICALFCAILFVSVFISGCQSASIYPSPCLPNIQSSQPACWWEVSLFSLLNFPTSGRFLTDSHTSVPLFLLTSLLGLCAGGMRTQRWAVRNHWASCLTWPYDSQLPHFPPLSSPSCLFTFPRSLPSSLLLVFVAVHS